jgi:hypothetical protein
MTYWRVAVPVWLVVSAVFFAVSVADGYSIAASLGWALGWFTVVLGLRWLIVTIRPYARRNC